MKTIELDTMDQIIFDSLEKGINYAAYRDLVSNLVVEQSTTGNEKTEDLVNYTMLNDRRMNRWDKTIKVSESAQRQVEDFNKKVTWIVITESWCGDAAHIVPAINKVAELNSNIDFRIVLRDENDGLMNAFLTNGGRAIPKLIMLDTESHEVLGTFGPRPSVATKMVNDFKAEHGKLTAEFKEDLQRWYNKDKGQSTIEDLVDLLG